MIYEFSLFILNNLPIRIDAIVQHMNNNEKNQDYLNVLRKFMMKQNFPRRLAKKLGLAWKIELLYKALKIRAI